MALTYPYSVAFLSDLLPVASVSWSVQRNDELSGVGDGRLWQAELADPLWTAEIGLRPLRTGAARQIAAKVRALNGSQESVFLCDPMSWFPQADPGAKRLGDAQVFLQSASTTALALSGLPPGYRLTAGDKLSLTYETASRFAFLEVSEDAVADENGVTPAFSVFPHVPPAVTAGTAVTLNKPACRMVLQSGGFSDGKRSGSLISDMSLKLIQKK
ncbi:hypothetical protein NAC44_08155 [Allorhizobium sp. BGMRC 0089]|uniref:hypothetical protein n=1 Tax=Allorhizobium sonneratiae TaxID=2934936 RepID=UPI0020347A0E|nr:hypothetical protein [Allorhizobium sonneratiae]MCM2292299.1 hypothetical protein [Allorhizobium sonneratiae]